MKDAVRRVAPPHQLIQARIRAAQHEVHVSRVQHHAFRLARCPRGVNNRHRIVIGMTIGRGRRLAVLASPPKICPSKRRVAAGQICHRPISQRRIRGAHQCRRRVLDHAREFGAHLARVERHHDQPLGHHRQIERRPSNAIRREQCATVAALQSARSKKSPRPCDHREELAARNRNNLSLAHFAHDGRVRRTLQSRENCLQKRQVAAFGRYAASIASLCRSRSCCKPGLSGGKYSSHPSTPVRTGNSGYRRATCASK